jgi:hypothetical protein
VNIDSYSIWSPNALESALAVVPYGQPDEWALAHLALLGIASLLFSHKHHRSLTPARLSAALPFRLFCALSTLCAAELCSWW